MNANAESPDGGPAQEVADLNRAWQRDLVRGLLAEAGAADPAALTRQLVLLYDGATVAARLDGNRDAAVMAKAAARALLAAAGLAQLT
jgi:hypothetical protein